MSEKGEQELKKPQKVIQFQLTEAAAEAHKELMAARSELISAKEEIRQAEFSLYIKKRRIAASFESIRDYFQHDPKIEVFESAKEFAEKWEADIGWFSDKILHFISVSDLSDSTYDFKSARWQADSNNRITKSFGIAADGGFEEIARDGDSGAAYTFNPMEISGFIALNQYLEFLRSVAVGGDDALRYSQTNLSAVIEEIYLPFYRQPVEFCCRFSDSYGRPLESMPISSWIPISQVRELIKQHLEKKNSWLYPLELWAHDNAECTTQNTFIFRQTPNDVQFEECEAVQNRIPDDAYWKPDSETEYLIVDLSGHAEAYSFPFQPETSFTGVWGRLRILCKISKRHSASYLENLLSAKDGKEVIETLRRCVETGSLNSLKNVTIELPLWKQQIQEWVNSALESGRLRDIRERIITLKTNKLTNSENRQLNRVKLSLLEHLIREDTNSLQELDRVIKPLPYFFEYPILQWKHATEKMAFNNAVSLFHQLNKISCLIGFEEILGENHKTSLKSLLGDELVTGIAGKPSLGHWSKALDIVERKSKNFKVWKRWFETFASERETRIKLIGIRNRIAHPDFILEEDVLDQAAKEFAAYFERIIPKLRAAYSGVGSFISRQRKLVRGDDGKSTIQLDCEKMDVPVEPFPRITLTLSSETAASLADDSLFCVADGSVLELRHFFRLRQVKTSKREIYLYEREYSGHEAIWSGLTTSQSGKLEAPDNLFS